MRLQFALLATLTLTACAQEAEAPAEDPVTLDEIASPAPVATEDALVPGTDYHATADIDCTIKGVAGRCKAGVKRGWGEDGTNLIEITKPDGMPRAIFLDGTTPIGADSAEADGSAGWDFEVEREGDQVTFIYGPETYSWRDVLVEGD